MGNDEVVFCFDCREYHGLGKARLTLLDAYEVKTEQHMPSQPSVVSRTRLKGALELAAFLNDHNGHVVRLIAEPDYDHIPFDFTSDHLVDGDEERFTPWIQETDNDAD